MCTNLRPLNFGTVKGRFVWLYASIQFALVVIFAHLFFFMVRVNLLLNAYCQFPRGDGHVREHRFNSFLFSYVDIQVHKEPILLIILATFAGFGVAMGGSIILFELLKWRTRLHVSSS